ncbi:hypothetical protein Haur_5113 (plasmid) [Herpetosiphon aurantiacus DSM 785]|uniref:Carboxypeptidase regulatory-like domain-containing protein n=1 Tax=Herpetosiphon aurantiacus (strain ATCC 23779 / DSM 785 / 114-95) TaxID=316274 RepID=A9B8S7_HERA2|nr:hypothetical protein Haur_5113 [Herpetosiphon aurantiacus DSM 785]
MIGVRRVSAWLAAITTIVVSWPSPAAQPVPLATPVVQLVAQPSVAVPGMAVTVVVTQPAEAVTATLTLTLSPVVAWDRVVTSHNRACVISGVVATCGELDDPALPAVATLAFTVPVTATEPLVITAWRSDVPAHPMITTVLLDLTRTVTPVATATATVVVPSATATEEPAVTHALPSLVPATATDAPTATAPPTATPTSAPTATATASSTPQPTASPTSLPTALPAPLPILPTAVASDGGLPPIIVFPTLTTVPIAPVVDAPSGTTTPPVPTACVVDGQPVAVVDSQIRAGVEPCALLSLPLAVQAIPPALAHVVAEADSELRAGPGLAYVPLAHIPRGYGVTLTGRMFQGYVEVTAFRVGAAPLAGWLWSADLIVDALLTTPLPPVADPVAALPSPAATLPPMADPVGVRPTATLPVLGWRVQALPATTRTVTVQVCRGTATCGRDQGIAGLAVVVDSAAGDRVAQGWTDATGRWVVTLPMQEGLVVRVPWLGSVVALAATAERVHLPVNEAVLPPRFGGTP